MATLSEYLQNTGTSQKDFALLIGVDKGTISRLAAKKMTPSLPLASKIETATNGQVKAVELLPASDAARQPDQGGAA